VTLAYQALADAILVVHFVFVVFVVIGFVLILIGLVMGWAWVRNRSFRVAHVVAIGVVVAQAWLGRICPLTIWENQLRRLAGQEPYVETFVQHWLHRWMFFDAEPWVFTTIYTAFGALVAIAWWLGGPPCDRR
jgi:cytochrome bd-type quinol oxidase subunit 1